MTNIFSFSILRLAMIKFYGLLDFYPNRHEIKKAFDKLTIDNKILYKKEVYSICFEKEYTKDLIWEFLNGWVESQQDLDRIWKEKKNKLEQRMKNENCNTNEIEQLERYYKSMQKK